MSVQFTLRTSRKTITDLNAVIALWTDAYQKRHGGQLSTIQISQAEGYYFFGTGSVRGFSVTYSSSLFRGGQMDIRLNVMASIADWRMCYSFLLALVTEHRARAMAEDGTNLAPQALDDMAARTSARKAIRSDFGFLKTFLIEQHEPELKLPNPMFDLVITQEDIRPFIQSGADGLDCERWLAQRAESLGLCRHANHIILKDGTTTNVLGPEPAIYSSSDYMAVAKKGFSGTAAQELDTCFVKFADFLEIFGDKIIRVKDDPARYYVSAINLEDAQDLTNYRRLVERGQDTPPFLHQH